MTDTSKRWIAGFEVESMLILPEDSAPLEYQGPNGLAVRIANGKEKDHVTPLIVHIMLDAENIGAARTKTEAELESFLRLMSFVTSTPFTNSRRLFVMDWSPSVSGSSLREALVWAPFPDEEQLDLLEGEVLETAKVLHPWSDNAVCQRALRWFAAAVRSKNMEDQFQYFWFVLELIAQSKVSKDRVPDVCQVCREELYCRRCEKVSTHRPFPGQQIAMLLTDLNVDEETSMRLRKIRNMLMHGDTREDIEAELKKMIAPRESEDGLGPLAEHVEIIGRVARSAALRTFDYPTGVSFQPVFLQVTNFVHRRIEAIADMGLGLKPGASSEPRIEDISIPSVTITPVKRERKPETNN